jgi:hypothetical protein
MFEARRSHHRGVAVMELDLVYYRRRSAEERAAAGAALHSKVRSVHLELARCYDERVQALETEIQGAATHLVSAA